MTAARAVDAVLSGASAPAGAVVGIGSSAGRDLAAGGHADAAGTAMTVGTAFDIASVTKVAATTTALLALVSRGSIRFDDPVDRYLPGTACAPGTTLRHLLQHRAGLWEWQPLYLEDGDPVAALDRIPRRYALDDGRHYSDLGFLLLGRVIQAVTDAPLDAAVRDLVTAPLGLSHTGFGPVAPPVASSALGDAAERRMVTTGEPYPVLSSRRDFPWRDTEISGVANDGNCFHAFGGVAGHAGLFSTADDLLTLGEALAAPDEHADLWHPDAVADLFRDGPDQDQATGWRSRSVTVDGREQRMLWHPGFTGCALGIVPAERTAVVLLTNRLLAAEPATTDALWRAALSALLGDQSAHDPEGTRTS